MENLDQLVKELESRAEHNKSLSRRPQEQRDKVYLKLMSGTTTELFLCSLKISNEPFQYVEGESLDWQKKYDGKFIDTVLFQNEIDDDANIVVFEHEKPTDNSLIVDVTKLLKSGRHKCYITQADDGSTFWELDVPAKITVGKHAGQFGEYYIQNLEAMIKR